MAKSILFDPTPSVAPQSNASPYPRADTSGAFGEKGWQAVAQLGQSIQGAAETGLQHLTIEQRQQNETHSNELTTWLNDAAAEKEAQFKTLQGKAALDAFPQYKKDLNDLYDQALSKTANPEQKQMLTRASRAIVNNRANWAGEYTAQQEKKWEQKTALSGAESFYATAQSALLNGDETAMQQALHRSDDDIRRYWASQGVDPQTIDVEVKKQRGKNLAGLIELKSTENPVEAVKMFGRYRDQMDPDSVLKTELKLRKANADIVGNGIAEEAAGLVRKSSGINSQIDRAASEAGVDPALLRTFVRIESGGNPNAVKGSYRGLGQLSEAEFQKHGGGNIFDPTDNLRATSRKIAAEASDFQRKYGRPPTAADLYLVHQQGQGGYAAHVANPDAPAWQNMASTKEGRERGESWAKQAIWGNVPSDVRAQFPGGVDSLTSRQFMAIWQHKVARFSNDNTPVADREAAYNAVREKAGNNPLILNAAEQRLNKIYTEYQRETTRESAARSEAYERSIVDASAGIKPLLSRADIEADPLLTEDRRNTLLRQYDAAAKDEIAINNARQRFETGGTFNTFDTNDRKAVDRIYTSLGGDYRALDAVTDRTGIVPKSAAVQMRGDLVSNNPAKVISSLTTASNLITKNPNIFAGVDGKTDLENSAVAFRHYIDDLGMDANSAAAKIIREQSAEYQASVKAKVKGEDVDAELKKRVGINDLAGAFDQSFWGLAPNPEVGFSPEMRQTMFSQYAEQVKERYVETGDWTVAKKQAAETLKKTWGVTSVNGSSTVMQYPPERAPVYAAIGDASTMVARQAVDAIKLELGQDVDRSKIRLMAIPGITGEAFKSGRPVPYQLTWVDQNGIVQMLNPGRAFVADPVAMKSSLSEERRQEFDAARFQMEPGLARQEQARQNVRAVREAARERILTDRAAAESGLYAGN